MLGTMPMCGRRQARVAGAEGRWDKHQEGGHPRGSHRGLGGSPWSKPRQDILGHPHLCDRERRQAPSHGRGWPHVLDTAAAGHRRPGGVASEPLLPSASKFLRCLLPPRLQGWGSSAPPPHVGTIASHQLRYAKNPTPPCWEENGYCDLPLRAGACDEKACESLARP
jgi:hypothetical protein